MMQIHVKQNEQTVDIQSSTKKIKLDVDGVVVWDTNTEWIHVDSIVLRMSEKIMVLQNKELDDNYGNKILLNRFCQIMVFIQHCCSKNVIIW